jgi:hypothetical protein
MGSECVGSPTANQNYSEKKNFVCSEHVDVSLSLIPEQRGVTTVYTALML